MSFSNKDRGLNKKIVKVVKDLFSDENSDIKEDIKKISDSLITESNDDDMKELINSIINKEITSIELTDVATIGDYAFYGCISLTSIILHDVTNIGIAAFSGCTSINKIVLSGSEKVELADSVTNVFYQTPVSDTMTYGIFVPDNLVDTYKADTNWAPAENNIKPISELTTE